VTFTCEAVSKAGKGTLSEIEALAEKLEPSLARAIRDMLKDHVAGIDLDALAEALKAGETYRVLDMVGEVDPVKAASVKEQLQNAVWQGGALATQAPVFNEARFAFNRLNPALISWLENYNLNLIRDVNRGTVESVRSVLIEGMTAGRNPIDQARRIKQVVGLTPSQAKAVQNYRKELETFHLKRSAKSWGLGNERSKQSGVEVMRVDAKTGKPVDGIEARRLRDQRYDGALKQAMEKRQPIAPEKIDKMVDRYQERMLQNRARTIARTECLPANTLVDAAMVRTAYRRWYDGEMVEVVTRDGRKLSATPNHPMLTRRGWVAAGEITDADDLIYDARQQHSCSPGNVDVERRPATIGEIFDALAAVGIIEREAGREPDFHGDGRQGEVEVLHANGELGIGLFTALNKPLLHDVFAPADAVRARFCEICERLLAINQATCLCVVAHTDASLVQSGFDGVAIDAVLGGKVAERDAAAICGSDLSHRQAVDVSISLAAVGEELGTSAAETTTDARALHGVSDETGREASEFCGRANAVASEIGFDRVLGVSRRPFSGHVFNFSTADGYFCVDGGVYTGNTLRATNVGVGEAWRQAIEERKINGENVRKRWTLARDERTCERCSAIARAQPKRGIRLSEKFENPKGGTPVSQPPEHPSCRCVLQIRLWEPEQLEDKS
jgi:hypothetical protein